jgi:hypothetical protein
MGVVLSVTQLKNEKDSSAATRRVFPFPRRDGFSPPQDHLIITGDEGKQKLLP